MVHKKHLRVYPAKGFKLVSSGFHFTTELSIDPGEKGFEPAKFLYIVTGKTLDRFNRHLDARR